MRGRWRNAESGRGRSSYAPASISLSVEPARRCQLTATVLHVRVLLKLQLEDHNLRQDSDVP